jgi:hypothetical protein
VLWSTASGHQGMHCTDHRVMLQGFLYRQILSRWQTLGHLDESVARAKHDCKGVKGNACQMSKFFKQVGYRASRVLTHSFVCGTKSLGCATFIVSNNSSLREGVLGIG